jgi:hypothetical protein
MGNLKKDVYRNGSSEGSGSVVGNIKNGVVRKGSSSSLGSGSVVGNIKNGVVKKGSSSSLGSGSTIGKTKDYAFKGSSSVGEAEAVALYHFLEKEIF